MWSTFRKFGMGYTDLATMLWNVTTLLKFLALDVNPRNEKPVPLIFYIGLIVISVCYYYVYLVSMIWFVFVRCNETGDLLAAIIVFSLGASSEISMTKLWCMFAKRKKLQKLISALIAFDDQVLINSRFAKHMKVTLRAVKKRAIIVWSVILWNGIVYIAIPLLSSERHFMEDGFEFLGFGNMATMKTSPYYEIAFTINAIAVFVTCYPSANVSALFIIIAGYIEAQMLALTKELTFVWKDAEKYHDKDPSSMIKHLKDSNNASILKKDDSQDLSRTKNPNAAWSDKEVASIARSHLRHSITPSCAFRSNAEESIQQDDRRISLNKYVRKRLAEILKSHSTNINLLQQVEGIFRIAIAFEFSLLSIGLTAELLGDLEKTYIQLPFALMTVSIDCFTGQRIKDASTAFERAVYECKWENFDVTNRKIILLMLRSSQKGMKLSAGGVTTLTLECLMNVLKTTYSAYTTLRTTMKQE